MVHLLILLLLLLSPACFANERSPLATLSPAQSELFRAWFVRIVSEQLRQGPSPRWVQRDCAGLVRYAVHESLRPHDYQWRHSTGLLQAKLPAELALTAEQEQLGKRWRSAEGQQESYVSALALIQENSRFVSRNPVQARPGDLLFYDQGDDQHLMIWLGDGVAYHRGSHSRNDNGMRRILWPDLLTWKDSRWQPTEENANFLGIYSFSFLSP
ncbi:DUF1175 family protein [Candidatus Magnetaquicoccus inordinatus]|uniref:DUF1175 family protein n=1 Tax=Candidatus Magnetaquicoccus inordinatus TaxID=2496818 RepID=UPI00102CA40D|nr:DUF1175 family protein [Candidatus Magnetaquicoccus inordinatus]